MYMVKVKGIAKIPDYVQLRDEKMTLLSYFRVDRPEKALAKMQLNQGQIQIITDLIAVLPFGVIQKIDL